MCYNAFMAKTNFIQNNPIPKPANKLRVPPQALDAEMAVLGALMLKPQAIHEIADFLAPDAFYADKNKHIYQIILELSTKGEPIDVLSVSTKLSDGKKLEQVGGQSYLAELLNNVPSATNIKFYADTVHKKYILRGLIQAGDDVADLGYNESTVPIEDTMDQAEKRVFAVTSAPSTQKFVSIKNTLSDTFDQIEKLHNSKDEIRGIPTGYAELDTLLAGFQKSDLIILAARPSMGKTTLALDMARMAAVNHKVPVGIFSLEMSSPQLAQRLLSAQSRVSAWGIRTGRGLNDNDFDQIRDSLDVLSRAPIYIDDQAGNSITKMRAAARRLKSEYGLGLIVVDYLQLMTTSKNYDSMVNQVTEISRSLKLLAKELDVPVIALSQLSRNVEQRGGKPRLSDLRDSGSIEQDADVVMFIHREDKYKDESERTNIAEILIEKHRNGPTGKVDLYFDEKTTTFLSIDKTNLGDFAGMNNKNSLDDF